MRAPGDFDYCEKLGWLTAQRPPSSVEATVAMMAAPVSAHVAASVLSGGVDSPRTGRPPSRTDVFALDVEARQPVS